MTYTAPEQVFYPPPTPETAPLVPPVMNPLTKLRLDRNLNPPQFAKLIGTTKACVQFSEHGCYNSPPTQYRKYLTQRDYDNYQRFRFYKRGQVPPWPDSVNTLPALLKYLDLSPYQFACKLCVQPAEVFRLLSRKARQNHIPVNLQEAFIHVGKSPAYLRSFRAID